MNQKILPLATFVVVSLVIICGGAVLYHLVIRRRLLVKERLRREMNQGGDGSKLFNAEKHWEEQPSGLLTRFTYWVSRTIAQSGTSIREQDLLLYCCLSGVSGAAACGFVAHWFLDGAASQFWWCFSVAAVVPCAIGPLLYVLSQRHTRLRKMSRQLPEAFEMMSRTVRVGQTSSSAMRMIAEEFDAPISEEFQRCYKQQELGIPQDVAMRNLAKRGGVAELQIFVMAIIVQSRCGGNLSELLTKLSMIVRARLKMEMKVRTLTGEGRMQAYTLILLPIVALIALAILSPNYIAVFFNRPWIIGAVAVAHITAVLWIRSIIKAVA